MAENGFRGIWEEMNAIDDSISLDLLEMARFDRSENNLAKFIDHHNRHKRYIIDGKAYDMTEDEYDDAADALSSYPAIPIGTGTEEGIVGYITQDGRKIKFIQIPGGAFMVAYIGDDVTGEAKTFYYTSIASLYYSANPFRELSDKGGDHRYKSDLDGGFDGLKFFKPVTNGKRAVTKEEVKQIKDDILNNRPISIK